MNHLIVHVPAPAAAPNLSVLFYQHSQGRKVLRTPFHVTGGSRFVVVNGHMRGYPEVPIRRTAIQLIAEPGVITRFMVFTRRGPSLPENDALAALSGGIRWHGDVLVVRRGKRQGGEYVNIGSGLALEEADLAVKLLLLHYHDTGNVPSSLGFVRDGVDMPFGGGAVFNVGDHQFHEVNNQAVPPEDGSDGDHDLTNETDSIDEGEVVDLVSNASTPPRRSPRLAASDTVPEAFVAAVTGGLAGLSGPRSSPRLAARLTASTPVTVASTGTSARTGGGHVQENATPGPSTLRAPTSTGRRERRSRGAPYQASVDKSCFSKGLSR